MQGGLGITYAYFLTTNSMQYQRKHAPIRQLPKIEKEKTKIKKVKIKLCKVCWKQLKEGSLTKFCTKKCQESVAKEKRAKTREKKKETTTYLKKKLWIVISEYIRRKYADSDGLASCVTCSDRKHWKELQAGHFVPSGSSSYLRYVENNIHPQCYHCNINLWSNPIEYRFFMEREYGKDFVDKMISMRNEPCSLKPYDLKVLTDDYEDKLCRLLNKK